MKRWWVLLAWMGLQMATAASDPGNLEGGVFLAHHPPGIQYSQGVDWCQAYFESFVIDSCSEQHNRIDLDANEGESSIWYVLTAWSEEKEWCGAEFGFGEYDPDAYAFVEWGPCSPGENLEIPTENWPGPNAGTAVTTTDTAWSGNFLPIYFFAGYAYSEGRIPLAADPATGFGGTGNRATPPESWAAEAFGGMGIFTDGIYACPEGGFDGGGGDGAGEEGGGGEGQDEYPGGDDGGPGPLAPGTYVEDAVIIRFAPDVISFPQDRDVDPQYFRAPLSDASVAMPALCSRLEQLGVESLATLAPSWRHLDANPSASFDLHGNPIELIDFTDVFVVKLSGVASVDEALTGLWRQPGIVYVEPDLRMSSQSCPEPPYPDDDLYPSQWYLNSTEDNCENDPHHYDLNVPEAWARCDCCGFGTKIAINDLGVNGDHEDLGPYVDAELSRSFPDPLVPWSTGPFANHGTGCASMAAAAAHNGVGLASIPHLPASWGDGFLVALRHCYPPPPPPPDETMQWSVCAAGIDYVCGPVVDGRVGVVSNSWGIPYHKYCYYPFLRSARETFRNAYRFGINLVCCAGNGVFSVTTDCAEPDTAFMYPAAFPDYCLAVAGIRCQGETNPAWFVGSYIDVVGPAGDVWVADDVVSGESQYEWLAGWQGTSLAAPAIAGAIALLLGQDPTLTNEDCYALLKLSANDMGKPHIAVGRGLPDLDEAMRWLTDCRVVHGSTGSYTSELEGQWTIWLRNVEGVNEVEDDWQPFEAACYRVVSSVSLPADGLTEQVWARGRGSTGWRLIDRSLDGNPDPHYDGLFYDNWARVVPQSFDPESGQCDLESYTYRVRVAADPPQWVWVPFEPGADDYRVKYSFVCGGSYEECVDVSAVGGIDEQELGLRVIGSPVAQNGSVRLRFEMPGEGKAWLEVYGADGRLVQSLADGARVVAGSSDVLWDLSQRGGQRVASGIYFVRLKGVLDGREGSVSRTRVVLVR